MPAYIGRTKITQKNSHYRKEIGPFAAAGTVSVSAITVTYSA